MQCSCCLFVGGVGWAATQLAKTVSNVTVVGTASSFKHEIVKSNGVDYVVQSTNYLQELNADEKLSEIKFDIIIDSVGGYNVEISQELLNTFGKVVVIGKSEHFYIQFCLQIFSTFFGSCIGFFQVVATIFKPFFSSYYFCKSSLHNINLQRV